MTGNPDQSPATASERAETEQGKWRRFLLFGVLLLAGGVFSVAVPAVSNFASSVVFAVALIGVGVTKVIQSLWIKSWTGFVWQELTGFFELIGGIMIYFNPVKASAAISLFIAFVLFVHGILQIIIAIEVRKASRWYWFVISGAVAVLASLSIILKWPMVREMPTGLVAGFSLMIAGLAYLVIALSVRKTKILS
ncbi:HdeD family acid-resistance protein [Mesorhizobium sp. B2-1-3A]|uniref:HdeD family acid-resistance protein n=1 Tax=Mesorhizobium sp. B2-1-3A TaxID=2589971 RepID=UPI001127E2C2|nr:HdeD family acid-resistance protein [Mesorhizobium sp. B2-1-3A]TPM93801.1 HdeD family acid-resistance protein [Mesorhizobium sp. B2-1-3A]